MNTTKHSPSPWRAVIEHETLDGMRQDLCPRVNDAEGTCICELWSSTQTITPIGQATQEANARLMAQAPALLRASENMANIIAQALLNGAWGERSSDERDSASEVESVLDEARAAIREARGGS